jgi:alkaline phosphatase D
MKNKFLIGIWLLITVAMPSSMFGQSAPTLKKTDAVTHGPQLGNITSHSIRVWARTKQPASFSVIYSTNADLSGATTSKPVQTTWVSDVTGWIELANLKANTKYYYAVVVDGHVVDTRVNGKINSFLTLPDAADYVNAELNPKGLFNFSFEVGTGNSQGRGKGELPPTYTTMLNNLKDRIYFQIQNGDWLYEEGRETTTEKWVQTNKVKEVPANVNLAKGITGVWENYKIYLNRSQGLSNFYKEVPEFVVVDDHEILNDAMGSGETGFRFDSRGKEWQKDLNTWGVDRDVERAVFRDPALEAWDDYIGWSNPDIGKHKETHFGLGKLKKESDVLVDPKADFTKLDLKKSTNLHVQWGFGNTGVYEIVEVLGPNKIKIKPAALVTEDARYSIGTNRYSNFSVGNTEFFLLDTRSNRTLHDKTKPDDPNASMLGKAQEEWLINGLKNSKADIFFIVSSVNLAVPHDNGAWYGQGAASVGKDDGWTAQLHQREKLLKLAESLNKPVFFLTGDLHKSFVARITPGIYDIASGPHTSGNHRLGDSGGAPPSGWYNSAGRLVNLLWTSNQYRNDSERANAKGWPIYTVIKVNNAYNIPNKDGSDRWIAYPEPQIIIEFHDGYTGDLSFAYAVSTSDAKQTPAAVPLEHVKVLGGIPGNK